MGFKEAFDLLKDDDNRISFFELFQGIKGNRIKYTHPLVYGIIKRIRKYQEVTNDKRIDFDTFQSLMLRAMRLSYSTKHANLIFNIFDTNHTGFINSHNLSTVSRKTAC